jgi:hypothetical protein
MSSAIVGDVILVSPLVFLAVGLFSGQRWSLVLPFIIVPTIYVGMDSGWWGNGVGDAWQIPMVFFALVGMLSAWAGVRIRQVLTDH